MTVNIPSSVREIKLDVKLDRLIDEMRSLRSHTIEFGTRLRGIEAYLKPIEPIKPIEPSEQQPDSKFTPWFAAAAGATARTALFAIGAAVGASADPAQFGASPTG